MKKEKLKSLLISRDLSIRKAMSLLTETKEKILFVVGEDDKLLGTVTDGDIRRGMVNGYLMDDSVHIVMKTQFIFVDELTSADKEAVKKLIKETKIEQIPVLDEKGTIIDVCLLSNFIEAKEKYPKTIAIIPARGGSKSIAHKNIKLILGKTLISYTIESCLNTPEIDLVVVSTDSAEIKNLVKQQYDDVMIIDRPNALATDYATSEDALLHAVEVLENLGHNFDTILFAQATSPLTEPEDFSHLINTVNKQKYDSAVFYTDDYGFFFGIDDILRPRLPRQVRIPKKREAGNAWVFTKAGFIKHKSRLFGNIGLCNIEYPKNIEIDSYDDLVIVERIMQLSERKKRNLYYKKRETILEDLQCFEENYWNIIVDPDGKTRSRREEKAQRVQDLKDEINHINALPPGKILDVGCGMGDLLASIKDGWEKYGVELSRFAAKEAMEHGEIFVGSLKNAPYEKEFFDVVIMNHVIEHLIKPEDEIESIRNVLKHGGVLIIGTPDFEGAMAERFGENYRLLHDKTHISLFSRISLRHFLEDFGFEIEKEQFPFFKTRHFTQDNLLRLFDTTKVSPPFWGSFMTFYCRKK